MKINLRRATKRYLIVGGSIFIAIILAFTTVYIVSVNKINKRYETQLLDTNLILEQNTKELYITNTKIEVGELITEAKVNLKTVYSSMPSSFFIGGDDIGKIAKIDISANSFILKSMVLEEVMEDNIREEEFGAINLNSNLKENDIVDIRILFPNGEDYTVLSKKAMKNLSLESNNCFLWLNEEETLTISSAIVDAYMHEGTKLYTAKYIEPSIQEPTVVNYEPNQDVIKLMKKDPNIVKVAARILNEKIRAALEKRLNQFYGRDGISSGLSNEPADNEIQEETKDQYTVDEGYIYSEDYDNTNSLNSTNNSNNKEEIQYVD